VPPAATVLEATAPLSADPRRAAILLDVDGTLAPIVRHADDASVPERTRTLLIEISRRYGMVACVSGRRASDARRIVSIGSITYVGNHGAEVLRGGRVEPELDPELEPWLRRVHAFVQGVDADLLRRTRVRVEDKGPIVAFHWRGTPDEADAEAALAGVANAAERAGLRPHWGRKVLEIRPPIRLDKGTGIAKLLRDPDVDAAMYVGDDTTDLDAFRGLRELVEGGRLGLAVLVGVRSEETPAGIEREADLLVDGTGGVATLLEALVAPR
jgi:trehalose 6-phosphate phosphatase